MRLAADLRSRDAASANRGIDISQSIDPLINRLPSMSFGDLAKVWRNALRLSEGKQRDTAQKAIVAIEAEWARRGAAGVSPDDYFKWPSTDAPGGDGQLSLQSLMKEGMLKYLEYQVGRTNGQPTNIRRLILRRVFEGSLPPVFPPPYMAEWGGPKSSARLHKLADTLAALARLFKRRHDGRFDDAISDWEADLRFLYDEYYVGRLGFAWPATAV
ncbi:MAG: hypothetical protein ABL866_16350 [Devosia sp.]